MTPNKTIDYLNSINHFRAIAIVLIVAGHSYGASKLRISADFELFLANLITGSTALFVFISGFLFYHIFYQNFQYKDFMAKKLLNIAIPYLLISIPVIAYQLNIDNSKPQSFFNQHHEGMLEEHIIPFIKYLFIGNALPAYWYIPFILLTFCLSPAHIKFIGLTIPWQIVIIVVALIISLLAHRPVNNINVFHNVIYFLPVYLLGIVCAMNRETIYKIFYGKEFLLLLPVLLLSVLETFLGERGNYHKDFFELKGIDLMLLQKISLCLFFMVSLNRFNKFNNIFVNKIAETSFAIFFIHGILILLAIKSGFIARRSDSWILYLIFVSNIVVFSMLIAMAIKKILPKHSRYLIGY